MHRRKINQEQVQPEEDKVVLIKSQRKNIGHQSYSLLPGSSKHKRKGNPISVPYQTAQQPKHTPVFIDKCDPRTLFFSSTEFAPKPQSKPSRLDNLKKADESKRRSIPKPHGLGKAKAAHSSTDQDKYYNSDRLGKFRKDSPHSFKKPQFASLGRPSPSTPTITTLSNKQKALGRGRLPAPASSSPQSSQLHNPFLRPSKVPYHSFSQNHQHANTNRALPYSRESHEQYHQVNQHRRFESSSDEGSAVNMERKKKKKTTTTMMDISDNDDVYHSACSTPSNDKHDNSDNDSGNERDNNNCTHPSKLINSMHSKNQSSTADTKQVQQRLSPTSPSLLPSPFSPLLSSSTTKESDLHNMDVDSPAPVELSDDEMDQVNDTILFTYPVNRSKGSITVTVQDQRRLGTNQFLNDSIIDFYLKFLMDSYSIGNGYRNCNFKTRAATDNTHIFSSFFYNRLTHSTGTSLLKKKTVSYENVRKWTSKIDLFSKKYAIFPINENWHWYLVLVCNLDKCIPKQATVDPLSTRTPEYERPHIFILDSLGKSTRDTMTNINHYLLTEAQHRRNVDASDFVQPQKHYADVPRQDNSCDCGVFLLHFVDQFLNSPQDFTRILLDGNARHAKWKEDEIKEKRAELESLFRKIHREYRVEHGA